MNQEENQSIGEILEKIPEVVRRIGVLESKRFFNETPDERKRNEEELRELKIQRFIGEVAYLCIGQINNGQNLSHLHIFIDRKNGYVFYRNHSDREMVRNCFFYEHYDVEDIWQFVEKSKFFPIDKMGTIYKVLNENEKKEPELIELEVTFPV